VRCQECGRKADDRADGWRGYPVDEPYTDELPELAWYCPRCGEREFGAWLEPNEDVRPSS